MTSIFFFFIMMTYTIGFWYGSVLVGNREINSNSGMLYTVSDVIVIFFTVYMSGLNLGQIPECIKNFVIGRKAAARIFSVIDRQPLIRSGNIKITEPITGMTFNKMQYYY
jgi:ATP-binding cassette subfamily B (MDR/TAP) protein 1